MITYIKINGFKSFHDFEMEFTPFTVIAGANASGKSNLFDAFKLLSRLAESDNLKRAFQEQRGGFLELFTQYGEQEYASEMCFCVEMLVNKHIKDAWGSETTLKYTRLRYELKIKRFTNSSGMEDLAVKYEHLENLKHNNDTWIKLISKNKLEEWRPKVETGKRGIPYIQTEIENDIPTVLVPQDGTTGNKRRFPLNNATRTVLSSFDTIDFPHVLAAKEEMRSWKFLQLNPEDLSQPTNKTTGEDIISQSGKNLAAALFRIKQQDEYALIEISRKLQNFLPNFIEVNVFDDSENKQYLIKLKDRDKKEYTSRVLSEGTLRILALCILEFDEKHTGLLCFEEPENGIHPFRIKTMANLLKDLSTDFTDIETPLRQVVINTHSPILVGNILESYLNNKNVSIWLSQMVSKTATIQDKKTNFSATIMQSPFSDYQYKDIDEMSTSKEKEEKRKYALSNVKKYLETNDFETLKERIK
ncbi:MAG: ATPase [Bacteroidetes bacterium]|nr:MAG: ATPase [Bacteroidota bacterium]TAG90552.1 MAG: ATPase [Bacteroidota bacterium]